MLGLGMGGLPAGFGLIAQQVRRPLKKSIFKKKKRLSIFKEVIKKIQFIIIGYQCTISLLLMIEDGTVTEKLIILYYFFTLFKFLTCTDFDFLDWIILLTVDCVFQIAWRIINQQIVIIVLIDIQMLIKITIIQKIIETEAEELFGDNGKDGFAETKNTCSKDNNGLIFTEEKEQIDGSGDEKICNKLEEIHYDENESISVNKDVQGNFLKSNFQSFDSPNSLIAKSLENNLDSVRDTISFSKNYSVAIGHTAEDNKDEDDDNEQEIKENKDANVDNKHESTIEGFKRTGSNKMSKFFHISNGGDRDSKSEPVITNNDSGNYSHNQNSNDNQNDYNDLGSQNIEQHNSNSSAYLYMSPLLNSIPVSGGATIIQNIITNNNEYSGNQQDINIKQSLEVKNVPSTREEAESYRGWDRERDRDNNIVNSQTNHNLNINPSNQGQLQLENVSNMNSRLTNLSSNGHINSNFATSSILLSQTGFRDVLSFIDETVFLTTSTMYFKYTNIKSILKKHNHKKSDQYLYEIFNIDLIDGKSLLIEKYFKNFYDMIQSINFTTIKSILYIYKVLKEHPTKKIFNLPYNFKNLERLSKKFNNKQRVSNLASNSSDAETNTYDDNNEEDRYFDKIYLADIVNLLKYFSSSFWDDNEQCMLEESIVETIISKHSKFCFCYNKISISISFIEMSVSSKPSVQFLIVNLNSKCNMIALEDKNQFKNALLNSIDHEIRTPLNYILVNTELLLMELDIQFSKINKNQFSNKKMYHKEITFFSEKSSEKFVLKKVDKSSDIPNNQSSVISVSNSFRDSDYTAPKINLIKGDNAILNSGLSMDYEKTNTKLKNIFNCSKHAHLIIQSFVDFAHMDTQKFSLNIKKVNIKKLIDDVIDLYSQQVQEKSIEIKFNVDISISEHIANYQTDGVRLKIIFLNLIHNALKFTNYGGIIEILIKEGMSNQLNIKIKDNGVGIDPKNLKLLKRNLKYPLKNYTKSPTSGIGLGLRFVSSYLRYLGQPNELDELYISSQPDKETTFSFWLRSIDPNFVEETYSMISKNNYSNNKNWIESTLMNNMLIDYDFNTLTIYETEGTSKFKSAEDIKQKSVSDDSDYQSYIDGMKKNWQSSLCSNYDKRLPLSPDKKMMNYTNSGNLEYVKEDDELIKMKTLFERNYNEKCNDVEDIKFDNKDENIIDEEKKKKINFKKARTTGKEIKSQKQISKPYWMKECESDNWFEPLNSIERVVRTNFEKKSRSVFRKYSHENDKKSNIVVPEEQVEQYNISEGSNESCMNSKNPLGKDYCKQYLNKSKHNSPPSRMICDRNVELNNILRQKSISQIDKVLISQLSENDDDLISENIQKQTKNRSAQKDLNNSVSSFSEKCNCNNIMIVDDETFNLSTLSYQLNAIYNSVNVFTAIHGLFAVESFRLNNQNNRCKKCLFFKLIILDLNMPVMDGGEACKQIIEEIQTIQNGMCPDKVKYIRVPIIIGLTAYTDHDSQKYGINSGMKMVLNKPTTTFEFSEIFEGLGLQDNFNVKFLKNS